MTLYSILATVLISLVLIFLIARISSRPFWSLWMVLLIVFLATWSGQIWFSAYGPVTVGISWYALIIVSVFVALLTMIFLPGKTKKTPVNSAAATADTGKNASDTATIVAGVFFWITMILLIVLIGLGYYFF
jgi:hypothetical protein